MRHVFVVLVLISSAAPALGQLALPGAVVPTPEGGSAPVSQAVKHKPSRPRPVEADGPRAVASPAKVPTPASLAGQTLYQHGNGGEVSFTLRDRTLVVSHLTLSGRGDDGAECRIAVGDMPLAVRDEGQPDGMARISIPVPACPIAFDVLDGSALETGDRAACAFKETHCTVDPAGLWGPPASAMTPETDKAIEHQRTRAEADVRASFKRLVSTTKDRPTIMGYAREQAQFSSTREEMCRGYAGELKHGFCATRVTEARAAALRAKADLGQTEKDRRRKKRQARKA